VEAMGLRPGSERFYTAGDRRWNRDVQMVRLKTDRIRAFGWKPSRGTRQHSKLRPGSLRRATNRLRVAL
jgi:hypothetical protein